MHVLVCQVNLPDSNRCQLCTVLTHGAYSVLIPCTHKSSVGMLYRLFCPDLCFKAK